MKFFYYIFSMLCFHAFSHLVREIVHVAGQRFCYDDAISLKFPEIHFWPRGDSHMSKYLLMPCENTLDSTICWTKTQFCIFAYVHHRGGF